MPAKQLQSFADKSGKSLKEVEKLWDQAKAIAKKEYPNAEDDRFYAIVTGILKKSLGLKEDTFLDLVDSELSHLSEMEEKKKDMEEDDEDEEVEDVKKKKKKKDSEMNKDESDEEVEDEKEK